MLFNSLQFFLFFPIVTVLYFVLPHKYRWAWLLAASCYFYMALIPIYILILGFTIVVDYFAGVWIEKAKGRNKKWLLICSLIANIGVLAFFKYYNFLNDNLTELLGFANMQNPMFNLSIILPVGLSFHTFQAMSYTIEVYRGKQKAEQHFGIYALYVMFYSQLVAGPIERPQNMLNQFKRKHNIDWVRIVAGLKQMLWGLFKKVLIADRLAEVVDTVYNSPGGFTCADYWIASIFFAFQIYYDFSGYSDIAIGSARVMGFDLMTNFNRPYAARTLSEFWSRWHISLSTWFKDYVYIPLGGNRVKPGRLYFNLLFVFMLSGLWHGASWTFVMWGFMHGVYLIMAQVRDNRMTSSGWKSINKHLRYSLNVSWIFILSVLAWVFFRAASSDISVSILNSMLTDWESIVSGNIHLINYDIPLREILICFFLIAFTIFLEWVFDKDKLMAVVHRIPFGWRLTAQITVLVLVLIDISYAYYTKSSSFIYFQF